MENRTATAGTRERPSRLRWLWFLPAVLVLCWTVPSKQHILGWQTGTASMRPTTIFLGYGSLVIAWAPGKWATPGDSALGSYITDGFTYRNLRGGPRALWLRPRHLGDQLHIPLWLIAMVLALPPAFMEHRRRNKRLPGCCKNCGYARAGLAAEAKCPECGHGA